MSNGLIDILFDQEFGVGDVGNFNVLDVLSFVQNGNWEWTHGVGSGKDGIDLDVFWEWCGF